MKSSTAYVFELASGAITWKSVLLNLFDDMKP